MFGQSSVLAAVQIANDLQNVSLLGTLIGETLEDFDICLPLNEGMGISQNKVQLPSDPFL